MMLIGSTGVFKLLFLVNILIYLHITLGVYCHDSQPVDCTKARTCSECFSLSDKCKWCTKEKNFAGPRCMQNFGRECPVNQQFQTRQIRKVEKENRSFGPEVQLRPQLFEIAAKIGTNTVVNINFKQAEDYPMDLYYLMDLSYTMLKHKNSVAQVGRKLADKLKKTTKEFKIGFGSFVDKETIPFANYERKRVIYQKTPIDYTHSFINHMPLKTDAEEFFKQVEESVVSGNLDSPEGTLDALMQVMVCHKEIGWRNQSDKIIVVATDEEFHYAGDGKIGGIIIPNDGKCHVQNNRYVASTIYDYPSMHHIAEVAQTEKFNLVFSVSKQVQREYTVLSNIIGPNARVVTLTEEDDGIVKMIEDVYRNISTSVEIGVEEKPDNVDVQFFSNCGHPGERSVETTRCEFKGKPEISFEVKITLLYCSRPKQNTEHSIKIGLLNKHGRVEIRFKEVCQCDCEVIGAKPNAIECLGHGTFSCGICTKCNGIRSGDQCECDPDEPINPSDPHRKCMKAGDSQLCSGHGHCVCAKCICEHMWAGEHCEQDESGCYKTPDSPKCNGQGHCKNNQCVCNEEYEGKHCDCIKSNATCINEGRICSDRGECKCGECQCKQATAHGRFCQKCPLCDASQYCDQILSCIPEYKKKFCFQPKKPSQLTGSGQNTLELTDSTQPERDIAYARSVKLNEELTETNETNPCVIEPSKCSAILSTWNYQEVKIEDIFEKKTDDEIAVEKAKVLEGNRNDESAHGSIPKRQEQNFFNYQCLKVINGCDVSYAFRLIYQQDFVLHDLSDATPSSSAKEKLHIKFTPFDEICPQPVNMVVVGSSAFFSVILLGLLTICIWKILTEYLDRREYERFMTEVDEANFSQTENPLYKDAKIQFRNPAFGLRERTSRFFFNKK